MIQDIQPQIFKNPYQPDAVPQAGDQLVIYREGAFLLDIQTDSRTIEFPKAEELKAEKREQLIFLFAIDEKSYFLYQSPRKEETADLFIDENNYQFYPMNDIRKGNLEYAFEGVELLERNGMRIIDSAAAAGRRLSPTLQSGPLFAPAAGKRFIPGSIRR